MSSKITQFTNAAEIQAAWLQMIATQYFDFNEVNQYRAGIFGYINEVMGTITESSFNAINIARREFYPVDAINIQSLYKMAALHKLDIPMVTPSIAPIVLLIKEEEILQYGKYDGTTSEFILDDSLICNVDNIPFMMDYPLKIISKKSGGKWTHTTHYDTVKSNSLNKSKEKYVKNKLITQNGENILLLNVKMHQVERTTSSQLITSNALVDIVTLDFPFEGDLANFEVFYTDNNSSSEEQIPRLLNNTPTSLKKYCYYTKLDDNILRIIFPKNTYFTPSFNSEVRVDVYTSLGDKGNFKSYKNMIDCSINSEKYPYNNNIYISGIVNGSSSGGKDKYSINDFRQEIINSYSTNNTFTTENDLQIYFDSINLGSKYKIAFSKIRDDALVRLYGAFLLIKDSYNNIVPTNTLDLYLKFDDFDVKYTGSNRLLIKPGSIFNYRDGATGELAYSVLKDPLKTINDDFSSLDSLNQFAFTNPFLISVTTNPNVVGFYDNTIDDIHGIEYSTIYDNSYIQFIANNLMIERNAIIGENFYKLSINIIPSVDDLNPMEIYEPVDETLTENIIRAKDDGIVSSVKYEKDGVYATISYNTDKSPEKILINSHVTNKPLYKKSDKYLGLEQPSSFNIFSHNDGYCAICYQTAPYIKLFQKNVSANISYSVVEMDTPDIKSTIRICRFSPNGGYFAVTQEEAPYILIYRINDNIVSKIATPSTLPSEAITDMEFINNGTQLVVCYGSNIMVYNTTNFTTVSDIVQPAGKIATIGYTENHNKLYVAIDTDPYIMAYDVSTFAVQATPFLPGKTINQLTISNDGTSVVVQYDISPFVEIRDIKNNYGVYNINHTFLSTVTDCTFTADDRFISFITDEEGYIVTLKRTYSGYENTESLCKLSSKPSCINYSNMLDTYLFAISYTSAPYHDMYISKEFAYEYYSGNSLQFNVGDSFLKNSIIAIRKGKDLGKIRVIGDINGVLMSNDMYIPFTIEKYDPSTKAYTMCAYISTTDYISLNKRLLIDNGICDITGSIDENVSIPIKDMDMNIHVFYHHKDINYSHRYERFKYLENYTITNTYTQSESKAITFIRPLEFIRGILTFLPENEGGFHIKLKEVPLVKAQWIKNVANMKYFMQSIVDNYNSISNVYTLLENNFSIDMKFFNTYGKSRFYKIGIKENKTILNKVNCSLSFGVSINTLSSADTFKVKFRTFIKEYIESINDVKNLGKSIYILNMISDAKTAFPEINYIEYYGMNDTYYDHGAQKIESMTKEEILESSQGIVSYVPEFINIASTVEGNESVPKIDIQTLD